MFESQPSTEPVFCTNCKHLIGARRRPEDAPFWKCGHPLNVEKVEQDLVTGLTRTTFKELEIRRVREDPEACGPGGRGFEQYIQPTYTPPPSSKQSKGADALLNELESL
jgi:hypothetical protein